MNAVSDLVHGRRLLSPNAGAVALLVLGLGALSTQDVFMKELSAHYSALELLAIRSLFTVLAFRFTLGVLRQRAPLTTRRPGLQLARGSLQLGALTCFYTALSVMPLLDVVAIMYTAPIVATAMAAFFLKEPVGWKRWAAVIVGFAGGLLMLRPGGGVAQAASLIAFAASGFYASAMILTRRLGATESAATTSYWTMLCYLGLAAFGALIVEVLGATGVVGTGSPLLKPWADPEWTHLIELGYCGTSVAIGFFCLAQAYRMAQVTVLAPFEYTALIWSGVLAYVAWGDIPTLATGVGAALIIASGIYIARSPSA